MTGLASDVKFAIRSLSRTPVFTAVAVLTLAIGIGANTAIFSFVDGVMLKPLPYPDPERIVQLWEKPPGGGRNGIASLNFLDWKKQNQVFSAITPQSGEASTWTQGSDAGEPQQLRSALVSAAYWDVIGIKPARRAAQVDPNIALRYE